MPHSLFIRWFIVVAVIAAASILAGQFGLFTLLIANDASYICAIIMGLFVVGSGYAGVVARRVDAGNPSVKARNTLHYLSETFTTLGLLGSFIGFSICMQINLVGTLDTQTIIKGLVVGTATALYTSLVGLIAQMLLKLQLFLIENHG